MKTVGMLGGMSWESTSSYYTAINEGIKTSLGGLHSAKICMVSVDFHEVEVLQSQGNWDEAAELLAKASLSVQAGGADFLLICTNTMHKVAPQIEASLTIPILHIADATALELKSNSIARVGLLGTRFTMEQDFYKGRLSEQHGIEVLVPDEEDRSTVHEIIYNELCLGEVKPESKAAYVEIINKLHAQGAQAVILGCTEIALLVQQQDTHVPLYDTTEIHAMAAVNYALKD